MKNNDAKKMSSGSVVKLIIAVLILLAIVVPAKPEILFFLSDAQKNSIANFPISISDSSPPHSRD